MSDCGRCGPAGVHLNRSNNGQRSDSGPPPVLSGLLEYDSTRIWALRFEFEEGTVREFKGDDAFWGSAEAADRILKLTAANYATVGFPVARYSKEEIDG